jgi:uncharacterized linocin/CFP29 family protein
MDFLARDDAPLTEEQWAILDTVVTDTVKRFVVGRRFIPLYGPLGAGMPAVPTAKLFVGPDAPVVDTGGGLLELAELSEDFAIGWKALETADRLLIPVDWAVAAAAAYQLAIKEDSLVFAGLLGAQGRQSLKAGDWAVEGGLFGDVTKAIAGLVTAGHPGPYALAVSPNTHASLYRFYGNGGVMEITMLEDLMKAGVFVSPALTDKQVIAVEVGALNMDLAVGLDVRTAYLGPADMTHPFRILETLALRIKRPTAICVIGK